MKDKEQGDERIYFTKQDGKFTFQCLNSIYIRKAIKGSNQEVKQVAKDIRTFQLIAGVEQRKIKRDLF